MLIPRYWARRDGAATRPDGESVPLTIWGWSNENVADALARAQRRLAEVVARIGGGAPFEVYLYAERVLREEIVRACGESGGGDEAIVTRNRNGVLVLNAARVPFIDIDVRPPRRGLFARLLDALRRRTAPAAPEAPPGLDAVRAACVRHADDAFRIYQTRAGFRVILTSRLLDPTAAETRALLEDFGADPAFVALCAAQASFRARLTAKPYRCACPPPPSRYPYETAAERDAFAAWLAEYEAKSAGYAACRYLESIGSSWPIAAAREVIAEHDRGARAESGLPLA
jgi:hypothetical protein